MYSQHIFPRSDIRMLRSSTFHGQLVYTNQPSNFSDSSPRHLQNNKLSPAKERDGGIGLDLLEGQYMCMGSNGQSRLCHGYAPTSQSKSANRKTCQI